jgi:hypothetical protein
VLMHRIYPSAGADLQAKPRVSDVYDTSNGNGTIVTVQTHRGNPSHYGHDGLFGDLRSATLSEL